MTPDERATLRALAAQFGGASDAIRALLDALALVERERDELARQVDVRDGILRDERQVKYELEARVAALEQERDAIHFLYNDMSDRAEAAEAKVAALEAEIAARRPALPPLGRCSQHSSSGPHPNEPRCSLDWKPEEHR